MGVYDEPVIRGFERACDKYPDKAAIIYLGEAFSYAKLMELTDRFATALHDLGVKVNDRVVIYIPNCPQWLIAFYGVQKIGAVPVAIAPIYTLYEIEYLIKDAGAETIVCQDTNFGYVKEVFPKTPLKRVIVTNYVDLLPLYKRVIGKMFDKIPDGVVEKGEGIYFFKELLHKYSPQPPRVSINPREHLAYILYTGGTTGFPKGCQNSHSGVTSTIIDTMERVEGHISEGEDILIFSAPLFHQFGQTLLMAMALYKGNPSVIMPSPQIDAILEAIQRYRGTVFAGVPTLYRMILENDRLDLYDLSSLRYCWSAGDVLPIEVYNRWKQRTHVPLRQIYGATEIGWTSVSPLDKEPPPGSIGLPLPSRAVKIVDEDTLRPVPLGETGELLVTAETMPKAYWNKPEETAAAFVEMDGKTWYRTKDYCRMGDEGLLYYVDRSADVIKYKAYRVSASEIEAVLQDHPAVIGACVVGVADPRVGERIKAMVVLKEDARGVGSAELISWCRERLASYKVPQYVEFRDMLPKSKVGKLLRREIREEERRRASKGERHIRV
jgi:long-chain acyl-CoA synthetase